MIHLLIFSFLFISPTMLVRQEVSRKNKNCAYNLIRILTIKASSSSFNVEILNIALANNSINIFTNYKIFTDRNGLKVH